MNVSEIYHTYKRYQTLRTNRISALPLIILMPHSACNCRCVMCDIWKDNKNLKQLGEEDIAPLLHSLKKLGTSQVLMSGGEALLNPNFFELCKLLKTISVHITLLTTGLSVEKHAEQIVRWVDEVIISLDGDELLHDAIRNIPGAFRKLKEGIDSIKSLNPRYPVSSRTVIHRLNFRSWPEIILEGKRLGLDRMSFLPADVSSHAVNRQQVWTEPRQNEILIGFKELPELMEVIYEIKRDFQEEFDGSFIVESPGKIMEIYSYYAAFYGLNAFPLKRCNAPWVSAVVEADGIVKPCFFHEAIGSIHDGSLISVINNEKATRFRETIDMKTNETCEKCVCSINLSPLTRFA